MSKTRNYQRFDTVRQVFLLDIDETLFAMEIKGNPTPSALTPDVKTYIQAEEEKPIKGSDPTEGFLLTDSGYASSATPLMSRHWREFFNRIIGINDVYKNKTHDPRPLITCKFLTDATYQQEKFLQNVFEPVYGAELRGKLFPDVSPVRYFNRDDQDSRVPRRSNKSDFVADYLFPKTLVPEGITKKKNVTLIDNSSIHCGGMISKRFSSVYVPTTEPVGDEKEFAPLVDNLFTTLHHQLDTLVSKVAIIQAESEVATFWTSGSFSRIINTQGIDTVIHHILADTEFWHQQMFIPGSDIDNIPEGIQKMREVALKPPEVMAQCANHALKKTPCCKFFSKPVTRSDATQAFYKIFETSEGEEKDEIKREAGADPRRERLEKWLRTHYVTPQARAHKRMLELQRQRGVRSIGMSYSH